MFIGFNGRPDPVDELALLQPDLHAIVKDVPIIDGGYETATIAWDGTRIVAAELFEARLRDDEKIYVLAFMAILIRMDGIRRLGGKDARTWSMACNVAAHGELRRRGMTGRPRDTEPLDMHRFDGLDEAAIYGQLVDEGSGPSTILPMLTDDDLEG